MIQNLNSFYRMRLFSALKRPSLLDSGGLVIVACVCFVFGKDFLDIAGDWGDGVV
jgi:hypothetical protein